MTVKPNKLIKISGKGAGLGHTLGANPDPVQVVLTLGDQAYCFQFSGGTFKPSSSYSVKDSAAPGACPP